MMNQTFKPRGIGKSQQELDEKRKKRDADWDKLIKERSQQQNKSRNTPSSSNRVPVK